MAHKNSDDFYIQILLSQGMKRSVRGKHTVLYTNSIIHINSDVQQKELQFMWRRNAVAGSLPSLLCWGDGGAVGEYYCSPLDWSRVVSLGVKFGKNQQNFTYGPIQLEEQLIKKWSNKHASPVSSPGYRATLHAQNSDQVYISTSFINKKLPFSSVRIEAISDSSKSPLLYECSALAKSQQELLKVIGTEKVQFYFGMKESVFKDGYAQIQFQSRLERDEFICQIMQLNGIHILENVYTQQQEQCKLDYSITFNSDRKKEEQLSPVGRNRFQRKTSVISINGLTKEIEALIQSQSETEQHEEVFQDLFPVLYTPHASKNIAVQIKKIKKDHIIENEEKRDSDLMKTVKHSDCMNLVNSSQSELLQIGEGNYRDTKGKSKGSQFFCEHKSQKSDPSIQKFKVQDQKPLSEKVEKDMNEVILKTSHMFNLLAGKLSLQDKISHLTRVNLYLLDENQKLKGEITELKNNQKKQSEWAKMSQIKQIMTDISSRISYLQGFNDAKNQSKHKSKSKERILQRKKEYKSTNIVEKYKQPYLKIEKLEKELKFLERTGSWLNEEKKTKLAFRNQKQKSTIDRESTRLKIGGMKSEKNLPRKTWKPSSLAVSGQKNKSRTQSIKSPELSFSQRNMFSFGGK